MNNHDHNYTPKCWVTTKPQPEQPNHSDAILKFGAFVLLTVSLGVTCLVLGTIIARGFS